MQDVTALQEVVTYVHTGREGGLHDRYKVLQRKSKRVMTCVSATLRNDVQCHSLHVPEKMRTFGGRVTSQRRGVDGESTKLSTAGYMVVCARTTACNNHQ